MDGCGSSCKCQLYSFIRYLHSENMFDTLKSHTLWFYSNYPQDYATYLTHRLYHYPFLYRTFHKMHHKYKQPTAFSVTAIHPVELTHMQLVLASPIVLMPVHWSKFHTGPFSHANVHWNDISLACQVLFYGILLYTYYHGIIDHSGITFKAQWWQPWQPDAIFHDNHHQYTHVNFGFNIYFWDKVSRVIWRMFENEPSLLKHTSPSIVSVAWDLSSKESCLFRGDFLRQRQSIGRSIARSAATGFGRKTIRESTSLSQKYQRKRVDREWY